MLVCVCHRASAPDVEELILRSVHLLCGRSLSARLEDHVRVVSVVYASEEKTQCRLSVRCGAKVKVWAALTLCSEARFTVVDDFEEATTMVRPIAGLDWSYEPVVVRKKKRRRRNLPSNKVVLSS